MRVFLVLLVTNVINNFNCYGSIIDEDELIAVSIISRHGDRAPSSSFPTDKYYNLTYWPMGFGQITPEGINRHHKLGKWLRQRYRTFLSDYYRRDEIYACSTDIDRTLMSAYATLAGLYPPVGYQRWNENIHWQPIPVHIANFLAYIFKSGCPKYENMLESLKKTWYGRYEEQYADVLQYIAYNTGWQKVEIDMIEELMDVLWTYERYNLSFLPEWTRQMDYNVTEFLSGAVYEMPTKTTPIARLRIGAYYDNLFKFFNKSIKPSNKKFFFFMAHESTLVDVMNTIGAFRKQHIEYADTIIWEFKKKKNGSYYVNTFYKSEDDLGRLNVLNCDYDCNYDILRHILSNITISPRQLKEECGHNKT